MLAVALDLDEREAYFRYVLAGGKPEKWPWATPDKAGTGHAQRLWAKLRAKFGEIRGDIGNIAQKDWAKVTEITEQMPDGTMRTRYVNEEGKDITRRVGLMKSSGEYFMKTKKPKVE